MRSVLILLFIFLFNSQSKAQENILLKTDQLLQRIRNGKDTVFVINFWATWCGPCVKELPNFEKLNNEFKNDKLKVLLVSVDFRSQLAKVNAFIKKKKFRTEMYMMAEKDQQSYIEKIDDSWSGAIPATLIISGEKRKFLEQEFTYTELMNEYLKYKQ